jgi:hypothetical protein
VALLEPAGSDGSYAAATEFWIVGIPMPAVIFGQLFAMRSKYGVIRVALFEVVPIMFGFVHFQLSLLVIDLGEHGCSPR